MPDAKLKPTLYVGHRVPFAELEPEPFSTFVFAVLQVVGMRFGWTEFAQTDVGVDGGFDGIARRPTEGDTVCMQSKRTANLSLENAATELAKVALTSRLEGSRVGAHLIVTSGKVRQNLRSAQREQSRKKLMDEAVRVACQKESLKNLRARATVANLDVTSVVEQYVASVELMIWSGHDFDTQLGLSFGELHDLLERTFVVHSLVWEHPRPDFNEEEYLARCRTTAQALTLSLYASPANPPFNIEYARSGDPLIRAPVTVVSPHGDATTLSDIARRLPSGAVHLLVGDGGSGKSTSLGWLVSRLADDRSEDEDAPLPVLVDLAAYRGSLSYQIDRGFGIACGSWSGLPGRVVALLDSLDLVPRDFLPAFSEEVEAALATKRVTFLIGCRTTGPCARLSLPRLGESWALLPCGPGHGEQMAKWHLAAHQAVDFLDAWLRRAATDPFVALAQGLTACVRAFADAGQLPISRRVLLETLLSYREKLEYSRSRPLPTDLGDIPPETTRALGASIAKDLWLVGGASRFSRTEVHAAVQSAVRVAMADGVFGADRLGDVDALRLLVHAGVLVYFSDGTCAFEHDALAGLFVSAEVARDWQRLAYLLRTHHGDDAWVLASSLVAQEDRRAYLETVLTADLRLASACAVEMGQPLEVERDLLNRAASADTPYQVAQTAQALGLLGTSACLDYLRKKYNTSPKGSLWNSWAGFALAKHGDPAFLAGVLESVERWRAQPVTVTGGEVDLWARCPPAVAVSLARERLRRGMGPVAASVETLARWGCAEDANTAANALLGGGQTLESFRRGVQALYALDTALARRVLDAAIAEDRSPSRIYLFELAAAFGWDVDARWLVDFLLAPFVNSTDPAISQEEFQQWSIDHHRAAKILERIPLEHDLCDRLLRALDDCGGELAAAIWGIGTKHGLAPLDDLAKRLLLAGGQDLGFAARFAATRSWSDPGLRDVIARVVADRLRSVEPLHLQDDWTDACQAELLWAWGKTEVTVEVVRQRVGCLASAWHSAPSGCGTSLGKKRVEIEMRFCWWASLLASVVDQITIEEVRRVLTMDLASYGDTISLCIDKLADRLTDDELDSCLSAAPLFMQWRLLTIASRRGLSAVRRSLLRDAMRVLLTNPAATSTVVEAVQYLWSEAVLTDAVEVLSSGPWNREIGDQFARPLVAIVVSRITAEQRARVVSPAARSTSDVIGSYVLRFILEATSRDVQ